jgi:hypothetical protein
MSLLVSLVLLAAPAPAATPTPRVTLGSDTVFVRISADDTTPASVDVDLSSDAGSETVTLTESDAWLHGVASLAALPAADSRVTLTLLDAASAPLASFSGTLGADGGLALTADSAGGPDVTVLGAGTFPAAGGVDVGFDLEGADVADVAYATFTVVESTEVTQCEKATGVCTTTGSSRTTEVEVAWDDLGAVWEGTPSLRATGVVTAKTTTRTARGKKIAAYKAKLGEALLDGGYGAGTLAVDGDPLTRLAVAPTGFSSWDTPMEVPRVVIVSDGWTRAGTVPAAAHVELTGGTTLTVAPNSFQAAASSTSTVSNPEGLTTFKVKLPGGTLQVDGNAVLAVDTLATPVCAGGWCVAAATTSAGLTFSFSAYALTAAALPSSGAVSVTLLREDGTAASTTALYPHFQDDVKALFVADTDLDGDPSGREVSGKVSLVAAADKKGKTKTLAKGTFAGAFSRDADGDLTLAAVDKDLVMADGGVITGATAVLAELTDTDGDGTVTPPPVAVQAKVSKEEAEAIKAQLVEAGATVEVK